MNALFHLAGAQGFISVLLGTAGWLAALVALGLALSRRGRRWALVLAGLVAGLGASAALWGQRCEAGSHSAVLQALSSEHPERRLLLLLASEREARASGVLGMLAGAPLLVAAAGVSGLVLVRRGSRS